MACWAKQLPSDARLPTDLSSGPATRRPQKRVVHVEGLGDLVAEHTDARLIADLPSFVEAVQGAVDEDSFIGQELDDGAAVVERFRPVRPFGLAGCRISVMVGAFRNPACRIYAIGCDDRYIPAIYGDSSLSLWTLDAERSGTQPPDRPGEGGRLNLFRLDSAHFRVYDKCMTSHRDYTAEYLAARIADRTAATLAGRTAAQRDMAKIDRTADRAGVALDLAAIDTQARKSLSA